MNLDIEGALKYRGKAVVVKDKGSDSHKVYVAPIELGGEVDGEWDDELATYYTRFVDRHGNVEEHNGQFTQCWPATWYKANNRKTSPDVVKGETVHLYEFGDTRVYFWKEDPRTDYLRRLEHIEWLFSNISDPTEDNAPQTLLNAYGWTISTRDKVIYLKTNNYDGEPFEHEIQLDTKNGVLHYKDDTGIVISAKSGVDEILVKNANDSRLLLDEKDATLLGTTNVNVIAEGGNVTVDAGGDVSVTAGGDADIKANKVTVKGDEIDLDCKKLTSTAKLIEFKEGMVFTKTVHATHAPFVLPG